MGGRLHPDDTGSVPECTSTSTDVIERECTHGKDGILPHSVLHGNLYKYKYVYLYFGV